MKPAHFIWKAKNVEIEREEAQNVTYRWIEQKKLRLAVKHGCSYDEVVMVYKNEEGKNEKENNIPWN